MVHQSNTRAIFSIASTIKSGVGSEMRPLDANFQPSAMDVICRRGKTAYNHNKFFRDLIQKHLEKYSQASSKLEKSLVVSDVVDTIREGSPNGGFVRCLDGVWYEVGDSIAREKCGGSFRDMLHTQYKSSTKAKKRRRQEAESPVATPPASPKPAVKVVAEPVVGEAPKKRRRVVEATTVTLPPLSPKSTKVLCAFGDLMRDVASRKQELIAATALAPKKPMLPPPARFPSIPKSVATLRGCSVESTISFDLNEMEEVDEFQVGLSRFTSVASTDLGLKRLNSIAGADLGLSRFTSVGSISFF